MVESNVEMGFRVKGRGARRRKAPLLQSPGNYAKCQGVKADRGYLIDIKNPSDELIDFMLLRTFWNDADEKLIKNLDS